MASNPIQRRARQSFLVGFLIALVIMAIVAVILFMQITNLKSELEEAQKTEATTTKTIYIANQDISSGQTVTGNMLTATTVVGDISTSSYIDSSYLYQEDEEGNLIEYVAKIDISSGSIITGQMLSQSDNQTEDSDRLMEYNMISLPSQLVNGDFVDIRFSLPDGSDYIVLSKKYVEQTDETGIWMKMSEMEILTLDSAIVESYMITGSRLYATTYVEAGMQEAATTTYTVNNEVLIAIQANPNILEEATNALISKYSENNISNEYNDYTYERTIIDNYLSDLTDDEKSSAVESGNSTEESTISTNREEYVEALEGTGLVGAEY